MPRRYVEAEVDSNRPTAPKRLQWSPPPRQYVVDPETGRRRRTYRCLVCEDRGVCYIPRAAECPGLERPEQLARCLRCGTCMWLERQRVICPACRPSEADRIPDHLGRVTELVQDERTLAIVALLASAHEHMRENPAPVPQWLRALREKRLAPPVGRGPDLMPIAQTLSAQQITQADDDDDPWAQ